MPNLTTKNSNDNIHYEIKEEYIALKFSILEDIQEFTKLLKFFIHKLKIEKSELPIIFKINRYNIPTDINLKIDIKNLAKKEKLFRYEITIGKETDLCNEEIINKYYKDLFLFLSDNIINVPWSLYDYKLNNNSHPTNNNIVLKSSDDLNSIIFSIKNHPYGIIFNIGQANRPLKILELIVNFLKKLKDNKVFLPFKLRMYGYRLTENIKIIHYSNRNDILVKQSDFLEFFKLNCRLFITRDVINYNINLNEAIVNDNGFQVYVDKKKQKSKLTNIEKATIENEILEILKSVES